MNLTMATSWLQHRWCLYICWLLQLPAVGSLALVGLLLCVLSDESPPAVVYANQSHLFLMCLPNANNLPRKAIQTSSVLHYDRSIHLPSHLVLHEPPHRYTHVVDPSLRKFIHDFPRRSDNAIVEFLVNQRFDRVDF
jgi:hypothetical protein